MIAGRATLYDGARPYMMNAWREHSWSSEALSSSFSWLSGLPRRPPRRWRRTRSRTSPCSTRSGGWWTSISTTGISAAMTGRPCATATGRWPRPRRTMMRRPRSSPTCWRSSAHRTPRAIGRTTRPTTSWSTSSMARCGGRRATCFPTACAIRASACSPARSAASCSCPAPSPDCPPRRPASWSATRSSMSTASRSRRSARSRTRSARP